MFYAALDVSLRSVAICIIDQDGKVRLERSVPSDVPDLVRCLREFGEPIHQVGLEAGTLTQHLTYGLKEAGFDVVCMEARQVNAALSAMRNKTDKHDARGIAQILRSGWYSRVHVKSVESHYIRALLTSRKVMQRKCIDLENEIRGLSEGLRRQTADASVARCVRCGRPRHDRKRSRSQPRSPADAAGQADAS